MDRQPSVGASMGDCRRILALPEDPGRNTGIAGGPRPGDALKIRRNAVGRTAGAAMADTAGAAGLAEPKCRAAPRGQR